MATARLGSYVTIDIARRVRQANVAPPAAPGSLHHFAFAGNAREYFGIWIFNVVLTVVTLGIYSAWAQVRARCYFYGNTVLDGAAFAYHAQPVQILKGRLIAVGALGAYILIVTFYPWFDLLVYLVILPAVVPWIVVRALRFRRRVSSHRNLRFGFAGTKREAFIVYVLLMLASLVTGGLLHPYAAYRRRRYQVERSSFGETDFRFDGSSSGFYKPYAWLFGTALAPALIIFVGIDLALPMLDFVFAGVIATAFLLVLVARAYLLTRIENYAWSHTRLGADRFCLELEFGRFLWIYLTNALAIVATIGLMIPWAQVRLARYKLSRLSLRSVAGLDGHVVGGRDASSATGDELVNAFDLDIGL